MKKEVVDEGRPSLIVVDIYQEGKVARQVALGTCVQDMTDTFEQAVCTWKRAAAHCGDAGRKFYTPLIKAAARSLRQISKMQRAYRRRLDD